MKNWYTSKTVLFNIVVFLGVLAQTLTNTQFMGVDPKLQAEGIAIINFVLRFVSNKPITPIV